jgi:hypothetical protein
MSINIELTGYWCISEVKDANVEAGHHFFDAHTLSFFRRRISRKLYGGRYFVTSEQHPLSERRYTVRRANDDGSISTIDGFQNFGTRESAHRAAARYAQEEQ